MYWDLNMAVHGYSHVIHEGRTVHSCGFETLTIIVTKRVHAHMSLEGVWFWMIRSTVWSQKHGRYRLWNSHMETGGHATHICNQHVGLVTSERMIIVCKPQS